MPVDVYSLSKPWKRQKPRSKSAPQPRSLGLCERDRFIPSRTWFKPEVCRHLLQRSEEIEDPDMDIFKPSLCDPPQLAFRSFLQNTLFGQSVDPTCRVLPLRSADVAYLKPESSGGEHWPIRPRRAQKVGCLMATLDLPNMRHTIYCRLVDWGSCGLLAASVGRTVFLWKRSEDPDQPAELLVNLGEDDATAVAWSPHDQSDCILALGTSQGCILIWHCVQKKQVAQRVVTDWSTVGVLAWHPVDRYLAAGTWQGTLAIYSSRLESCELEHKRAHVGRVSRMEFCADGSVLATGGEDAILHLWTWPGLQRLVCFDCRATVTALTWHPWRSTILAVGSLLGQISVVNLTTMQTSQASYAGRRVSTTTALTFSPRTGELVAAFRANNDRGVRESYLVVMSDLCTVVDCFTGQEGLVTHLLWSPDGLRLASVGGDESLCLWDFFGPKTTLKLAKKVDQDKREAKARAFSFGCSIR